MRHAARAALVAALALQAFAGPALAGVLGVVGEPLPFRVPPGYRVVGRSEVAPGVEHVRLKSEQPPHVVEIGVVRKRSGHRVDVRHAGPRSRGTDRELEGTSELCDDCAYATNGDYAFRRPSRVVGRPIGGIVERGVVLVSPDERHQQASYTVEGGFTTKRLTWSASVRGAGRPLTAGAKNKPRSPGALVLYTPDYVRSTGTDDRGAELTLRVSVPQVRPNEPVTATLVAFRAGGDTAVRPGTVVLSGSGRNAAALRRLWTGAGRGAEVELTESLTPGNVWASVGGGHILIRDGRRWLAPERAPHLTTRHPRTFAGVLADGTLIHATVDGRERNTGRSVGMPLEEAVRFFTALGAREVINMDGGGSTTFVRGGQVVNRPSDGRERPVTTAMVVVRGRIPRPAAPAPAVPRSRRALPEPPPENVSLAGGVPPIEPTPLAVWVAMGNIVVLGTALATIWARRGRPGLLAAP